MTQPKHPSKWRYDMAQECDLDGFVPIPKTDGYYRINKVGQVASRRHHRLDRWPGWWILMKKSASRDEKPVMRVGIIWADGKSSQAHVGQLVLEAFVGPRPSPEHHATHLNGDGRDDRLENLVWATVGHRMSHVAASGRTASGERHGGGKYSDQRRAALRKIASMGVPVNLLAVASGINQSRLNVLVRGDKRTPPHKRIEGSAPQAGEEV